MLELVDDLSLFSVISPGRGNRQKHGLKEEEYE